MTTSIEEIREALEAFAGPNTIILSAAIDELQALREGAEEAAYEKSQEEITTLRAQLETLRESVEKLQRQRDAAIVSSRTETEARRRAEAEITTLRAQRDRAELHCKTATEEAHRLLEELEAFKGRVDLLQVSLQEAAEADEREACAQALENMPNASSEHDMDTIDRGHAVHTIRARGGK